MLTLVTLLISFSSALYASPYTVRDQQFVPGNYWVWTYYRWDKSARDWKTYFVEKYQVVEHEKTRVSIEMSSSPDGQLSEPHHKFLVDLKDCRRAKKNVFANDFTVTFFTRNTKHEWQRVSDQHKNLVFTEKFNCSPPRIWQRVQREVTPSGLSVFHIDKKSSEQSWFFMGDSNFQGVAAHKFFAPQGEYKFVLTDWHWQK